MTEQQVKDWTRRAWLAFGLVLLAIIGGIINLLPSCGSPPTRVVTVGVTVPTTSVVTSTVTATETVVSTSTTTSTGTTPATSTATATATGTGTSTGTSTDRKPCAQVVTFTQAQPLLAQYCSGCHYRIDTYDQAKDWWSVVKHPDGRPDGPGIGPRIKLDRDQPGHMPQGPLQPDETEVAKLLKWAGDGFLKPDECNGSAPPAPPAPAFVPLSQEEQAALNDAQSQKAADQPDLQYLSCVDRIDAGVSAAALEQCRLAMLKGLNMVSTERALFFPQEVGPGLYRVYLSEVGMTPADMLAVEAASQQQLESFTTRGKQLKDIVGNHRRFPIMSVAEFNDLTERTSSVYFRLTKVGNTFNDLARQVGADFSGDAAAFKLLQGGFNGSQLSPAANRLVWRVDARVNGGSLWGTADTGKIVRATQNCIANPLFFQSGGKSNCEFAAGEFFYPLPNGMMGAFLAVAKPVFKVVNGKPVLDHVEYDKRLDAADPGIVHDYTTNPTSPVISYNSCSRCHARGFLGFHDEVRPACSKVANAADAQICLATYRGQDEIDRQLKTDNDAYQATLRTLGINPATDPISSLADLFLGDQKLTDVAGSLRLTEKQFTDCLNISTEAQQLLSGTISHDQLIQALPKLKLDCRLFQDPL